MAGNTEFIELIKKKCAGKPYNIEEYVNRIDRLIVGTHQTRYGSSSRQGTDGGFVGVDFETFQNDCWEALENHGLVLKFRDASFPEDSHLIGYIRKTFENMLQDRIYALSPGSRTRMKQVHRVLQPHALVACRHFCRCWKLREFKDVPLSPANLDCLMRASRSLSAPKLRIPKNPHSQRGPTIKDKEMETYLMALLRIAGGMTTRTDLFAFIAEQYALFPVQQVFPSNHGRNEEGENQESPEDQLSRAAWQADGTIVGLDHALMARELAEAMSPSMAEAYYHRIVLGETLQEAAREMKKSVGTLHNLEKSYQRLFFDYFRNHRMDEVPEEEACACRMVSEWIVRRRGKK